METLAIGSRVKHPEYGAGVIIQVKSDSYLITFIEKGNRELIKSNPDIEIIDALEPADDLISFEEIERLLVKVLRKFSDVQETVYIADKWRNGKIILQPGSADLKPYELPIDNFFHKIVMIRDRMRVLEQRVNASNLPDDEKVNIQQYITRVYGSLTSFNILFKNKNDIFVGSKE